MGKKVYDYSDCISKTELLSIYGKKMCEAYTKRHKVDYSYFNKYDTYCQMYAREKVRKFVEKHPELAKRTVTYKEHVLLTDEKGNVLVKKERNDITITLLDGNTIKGSNYLLDIFKDDVKKFYVANHITYWRHNKTDYEVALGKHNREQQISWEDNRPAIFCTDDYSLSGDYDFYSIEDFREYWNEKYEALKRNYNENVKNAIAEAYGDRMSLIGINVREVMNELRG